MTWIPLPNFITTKGTKILCDCQQTSCFFREIIFAMNTHTNGREGRASEPLALHKGCGR